LIAPITIYSSYVGRQRPSPRQNGDFTDGLLNAPEASTILCNRYFDVLNLARSSLLAQLLNKFEYLAKAGGTNWMAFALKPTRGVDWNAAPEARVPAQGCDAT